MIHIDICPSCEEAGDSKPKLLCDNCGFCIVEHCKEYCEIASLLRQTVRHEPKEHRLCFKGKNLII